MSLSRLSELGSRPAAMRRWPVSFSLIALAGLAMVAAACGGGERRTADLSGELEPVELPELNQFEGAVQEQIREAFAQFETLRARKDATEEELADTYGSMGMLYQAYDLLNSAAPCYRNARLLSPGDYRWHYYLGAVSQVLGEQEQAIEALQRATEVEGDRVAAWIRLGDLHLDRNEPEPARRAFEKAVRLAPDLAAVRFGLGQVSLLEGDAAGAVASFERALEIQPDATRVHYLLGQAYRKLGEEEKARYYMKYSGGAELEFPDPLVEEMKALASGSAAYLWRGTIAGLEGRFDDQLEAFRGAVEAGPDNAQARLSYGVALLRAGRPDAAREQLQEALKLNPRSGDARFALGSALDLLGEQGIALEQLEEAIRLRPDLVEARLELGALYERIDRDYEALAQYEAILAKSALHPYARLRRAEVLAGLGRASEGIEALQELIAEEGDRTAARIALGRLLAGEERWQEAREQFRLVAESESADRSARASARTALAAVELRQGRRPEAKEELRLALELDPGHAEAHFHLGALLGGGGDLEGALEHFRSALASQPGHTAARLGAATALAILGRYRDTLDLLEEGATRPGAEPEVVHALARFLATVPDEELRDAARALELSGELFREQPALEPGETMAMALAQLGRYGEAADLQRDLIARAGGAADGAARQRLDENLLRYERGETATGW